MTDLDRYARMALDCVQREYPTQVAHLMRSEADLRPARALTPAFYGCFDWHSAVHGHWVLATVSGRTRDALLRKRCVAALETDLTAENIAAEAAYLAPRRAFERPYGLAWLLTLDAELQRQPALGHLSLAPLVDVALGHLASWLPKLTRPTRSGVHSQTAFALGLMLDWSRARGRADAEALFAERALTFFSGDRSYALHLEPDGEDFLSPSLGAADLMTRILSSADLATWLDRAMPALGRSTFVPAVVTDPTDGRLRHLDGLNLSRAWMLRALARALPKADARVEALSASADEHAARGLAGLGDGDYAGAHWLGTFATYLLTR